MSQCGTVHGAGETPEEETRADSSDVHRGEKLGEFSTTNGLSVAFFRFPGVTYRCITKRRDFLIPRSPGR